ncbi:HutD family protein [Rhodococcus sp. NPDC003318]|uniref:HutD/Ves family protein n=1 Tax=Rhodococcus sp. NPDC003318 TaxID=3364503 RepID=UPI00368A5E2B
MTGPSVAVVRAVDRRRVPWRNGAGVTEEVASGPESRDGQPLWRISVADLGAEPSAFSAFDGLHRIFTVVGAHGVTLDWDTRSESVTPWHPHPFDGAHAPRCTPAGATSALNVMVDASTAGATVQRVDLGAGPLTSRPDEVTALFVRSGTVVAASHRVAAGDCLVVTHDEIALRGNADGLVIRIRIPKSSNDLL